MLFLVIMGAALIIVSTQLRLFPTPQGVIGGRLARWAGIGLVIIGLLTAATVQINPGRIGVITLFGRVTGQVLGSGLHLINPLAEVIVFDVTTQNYTMSRAEREGTVMGDDATHVLSADGLEVIIDMTILFRLEPDKAPDVLRQIGREYQEKLVRPLTRTRIRDNAANFDAVSLYSSRRDEFQRRVQNSLGQDFAQRGIVLEQLLIRNIDLPASVKQTIESKINAEQEAQKMEFVLAKEQREAERKRVEAQGIADYQRIMQQNLTDRQLEYERIKAQLELSRSPNSKVIIIPAGKSTPPLIIGGQ